MDTEQDIVNFCDITGASTEVAKNFLQIADNNVEMAISLYLESGGDLGQGAGASNNNATTSRPSSIHSVENMLTDEEIARQMQESEEANQRRRRQQQQTDEVRAPIAPRNDILAGGMMNDMMFHPSPISSRWQRDTIGTSRPSVFNQGDSTTGSVSDFLNRLDSPNRSLTGSPSADSPSFNSPTAATGTTSKAKRLADLFRPPFDIMFRGNFEEARENAKEKSKWLMINVQNPTEFQCQVLNRDLWSDSFVKDIIRESFIFLQYVNDTPDGQRYTTFYSVSGYPHLAIIDARTGERVKVWENPITPTDFMMDITEFLEQNSADSTHPTTRNTNMKRLRTKKNLSDMSEEEQLNAAIAASLSGGNKSTSQSPDNMDTDIPTTSSKGKASSIVIDDDEDENETFEPKEEPDQEKEEEEEEEQEEDMKAGSALDGIKAIKRDETKDMTNSTRIQLRMGDGSRIVRRFLKSDPVRYLFEFVKSEVPNAQDQPFELVFNRTQLIDLLDQTILEAGLSNAAVNCVFV